MRDNRSMTQRESVAKEEKSVEVEFNEGKRCMSSSISRRGLVGAAEDQLEHAVKVREVRDARRKRILARSSERLAYICSSGGAAAAAGTIDCTFSKSPAISSSLACAGPDDVSAAMGADLCRYHSLDHDTTFSSVSNQLNQGPSIIKEVRRACEAAEQEHSNVAAGHCMRNGPITRYAQSRGIITAADVEACKSGASSALVEKCTHITIKSRLSYCIRDSYVKHARLICAACTAIIFLVAILTQGLINK